MCSISGFSGSFEPTLLKQMNQIQDHRGPDDGGVWFEAKVSVGLAHRRLSIIDPSSSGHQPMWDMAENVVVIFNGEIYNFKELRKDLEKKGYRFRGHSDTEVLLQLYFAYGEEMLTRLNGVFAFALYDRRGSFLFLARDGVGVKPLYYSELPKGFLFASELKALLQEPCVNRELNEEAIHYYLNYLWCPAPHTMLKSVKKLEPGHALIVKGGRIQKKWQFYDLPYDQRIEPLSKKDAVEQLQTHLNTAVKRQMVADVPVGAFLSGGLDSSAVVAFAKKFAPDQKFQCFTIGFRDKIAQQEGMTNDLPYARRVADYLGVELHTIYVGPEMVNELEKMIYHLDEPQADPAPLHVLLISRLAKEYGMKVLLSGAGGDDIFTGYRRHYALMQEKYWSWMPKIARRGLKNMTGMIPPTTSLGRRVSKAFQYADLDGDERIASYFNWIDPQLQKSLYCAELREKLASVSVSSPLISSLSKLSEDSVALNRMLYLEGKHFLADHNLNYTDKMSMATGVEVRVPLLDPDLIAFAARLPIDIKQRGRTGKWIFKKAMEPHLPQDVIYRPKTGFGAPLRHWLRHELQPVVEDVLSDSSLVKRGLFDPAGVRNLVKMDSSGRIDGTYTIFSLICIELWCRIFIDHSTPVPS